MAPGSGSGSGSSSGTFLYDACGIFGVLVVLLVFYDNYRKRKAGLLKDL